MTSRTVRLSLAVLGLALMGLNATGLFIPLRNPDIYREQGVRDPDDIVFTEAQLREAIERVGGESVQRYVVRLNDVINKGIAHYWSGSGEDGIEKYNLRIPPHENYLLYLAGYVHPEMYRSYEYCNYNKALTRGVGLCSQHVIILTEILRSEGIESQIVELSHHVVAAVQVDTEKDRWWIADPDYGVVIKHSLNEIEANPEIVRTTYAQRPIPLRTLNGIVKLYGRNGNAVRDGVAAYVGWKKYTIEHLSYILIWLVPIALIVPYVLSHLSAHPAGNHARKVA